MWMTTLDIYQPIIHPFLHLFSLAFWVPLLYWRRGREIPILLLSVRWGPCLAFVSLQRIGYHALCAIHTSCAREGAKWREWLINYSYAPRSLWPISLWTASVQLLLRCTVNNDKKTLHEVLINDKENTSSSFKMESCTVGGGTESCTV